MLQQIDIENERMKPAVKELKMKVENLIKYMKSCKQDSKAVETTMMKFDKAWNEFQDKLILTKNNVNESPTLPRVSILFTVYNPLLL